MINIQNITKSFNNKKVLDDFSLSISSGERVVLFSKSGSGKTTLLRLIAGLDILDNGKILIDDKLVSDKKELIIQAHERGVGMVFQDLALWPHLNVKENIELALKVKKIPKTQRDKLVYEILKKVKLSSFENKKIYELSGGEQQRVALARTLVVKPKIILMDEPLSSLDNDLSMELREEILNLQLEDKFTLVYVTHNKDEANFLAQRIIEL